MSLFLINSRLLCLASAKKKVSRGKDQAIGFAEACRPLDRRLTVIIRRSALYRGTCSVALEFRDRTVSVSFSGEHHAGPGTTRPLEALTLKYNFPFFDSFISYRPSLRQFS